MVEVGESGGPYKREKIIEMLLHKKKCKLFLQPT